MELADILMCGNEKCSLQHDLNRSVSFAQNWEIACYALTFLQRSANLVGAVDIFTAGGAACVNEF